MAVDYIKEFANRLDEVLADLQRQKKENYSPYIQHQFDTIYLCWGIIEMATALENALNLKEIE